MKNKIKIETKKKKAKKPLKKNGFSRLLNALLNGEFLTKEGFTKHIPYVAFLSFLFLVFIGIGYFYENTLRNLSKYERKLEYAKHEYHTTLYKLEKARLRSQLIPDMESKGLVKTVDQPKIIEVKEGYFGEGE